MDVMKIGGSQSQAVAAYVQQARDLRRSQGGEWLQEQIRARTSPVEVVDNEPQSRDSARRTAASQAVVPAASASASPRSYQYYPFPDHSGLPARQQQALNTYSTNQHLGLTQDSRSEFLGNIDVFA